MVPSLHQRHMNESTNVSATVRPAGGITPLRTAHSHTQHQLHGRQHRAAAQVRKLSAYAKTQRKTESTQ
jgi:hypothetical protein